MKEKDKTGNKGSSDFLRYLKGEMTGSEKNTFERELQKDPFAGEALEGLSEISPEIAGNYISRLQNQIHHKAGRRERFVIYRIAASIAVLMIISSVFIIVNRQSIEKETGEVQTEQAPLEISQPSAIVKQEIAEAPEARNVTEPHRNRKAESKPKTERNETTGAVKEGHLAGRTVEPVPERVKEAILATQGQGNKTFPSASASAPAAVAAEAKKDSLAIMVKGRVMSAEDKMPIAGASVTVKGTGKGVLTDTEGRFQLALTEEKNKTLVADFIGMKKKEFQAAGDTEMEIDMQPDEASLSEVVVVGYGVKKAEEAENIETGYTPPLPSEGRNNFDKYIEDNIRMPQSLKEGEKFVVVIGFMVKKTGLIDSLKIIRSPGPEFSDEAKRLILQGPSWKPAVSSGETIDDDVRVRIVFKK